MAKENLGSVPPPPASGRLGGGATPDSSPPDARVLLHGQPRGAPPPRRPARCAACHLVPATRLDRTYRAASPAPGDAGGQNRTEPSRHSGLTQGFTWRFVSPDRPWAASACRPHSAATRAKKTPDAGHRHKELKRMTQYGYFLSCEENNPQDLVAQAKLAEQAGFDALWISDHYHPWLDEQGESGFVWSVIGAISQATSLPITTAVTCPLLRVHPAIIAQAAATSALLTGGPVHPRPRQRRGAERAHPRPSTWPSAEERLEMLEEAVAVIREAVHRPAASHHHGPALPGRHGPAVLGVAERAAVDPTCPASARRQSSLAAKIADGYINRAARDCRLRPVVPGVRRGRLGRSQGGLKVCWGRDACRPARPCTGSGPTTTPRRVRPSCCRCPGHFAQLSRAGARGHGTTAPCGPDPQTGTCDGIRAYTDAGFDEVYISQVGPEATRDSSSSTPTRCCRACVGRDPADDSGVPAARAVGVRPAGVRPSGWPHRGRTRTDEGHFYD